MVGWTEQRSAASKIGRTDSCRSSGITGKTCCCQNKQTLVRERRYPRRNRTTRLDSKRHQGGPKGGARQSALSGGALLATPAPSSCQVETTGVACNAPPKERGLQTLALTLTLTLDSTRTQMFSPSNFLDLDQTEHRTIFDHSTQVWDVLRQISSYLQFRLKPAVQAQVVGKPFISDNVYIGTGTVIEHGAMVKGPAWIGNDCQ